MKSFLRDHQLFWWAFLVFAAIGAVILGQIETGDLIFFGSANRSPLLDGLFFYGTRLGEEEVYLFLFILFLFYKARLSIMVLVIGALSMIFSFGLKSLFLHARPSVFFRELGLLDQINLVEGVTLHGGTTSFPSGHTMSAFALYSFLAFVLPAGRRVWGILLFLLALLVGLSRIYLVQHFFKDVYLGAWLGVAIGIGVYIIYSQYLTTDPKHWLNRPVLPGLKKVRRHRRKKPVA